MSVLWTDIITPAELTGYVRASLAEREATTGSLARYLPNREVADIVVRFIAGSTGLVDVAKWRAYDAAIEVGKRPTGKRVTLELPALGQTIPISEYEQLRLRGGPISDTAALNAILATANIVVRAVADGIEYLRGIVLATGKATIDQDNFKSDDNFGRSAGHQLVAGSLWSSATSVSRLDYLQTIVDIYVATNGEAPGSIVLSRKIARLLAQGDEFKTSLVGGSRPATLEQVNDTIAGAGLPPLDIYDRRVSVGGTTKRVLDQDTLLLLPPPVETDDWEGTDLGATFWGRTLTSTEPDWEIADGDQPGIVVGAHKNPAPPMIREIISDAIALPVLANADRSLAAKVAA